MSKRRLFTLTILVLALSVVLACGQTQPSSQEQQLQATINALQTQVAARQNQPVTLTSAPEQSQGQQLQATIVALQTQVAQPPSGPTAVSTPATTPFQDTAPGTILEVGQPWYQDNLKLELREADIQPSGIALWFYLTSLKSRNIIVRYDLKEAISAVDNLGRTLNVVGDWQVSLSDSHESFTEELVYGQPVLLKIFRCCLGSDVLPFVLADPSDLNLTEVVVTVNIHTIREARWRIEIPH